MWRWLWERRIWGAVGSLIVLAVVLRWYIDVPLVDGRTNYEALVTLLLSAGTFIGLIASLVPWLRESLSMGGKQKRAADLQRRNREELLKAVDEIWISGYLDKVLHQMESFPIELRYLEPEKVAQRIGGQPYALTDNRAALQTFRDFGGKLVILGEPGAGKTVLLLQLAEGLLGAAQQDPTAPVPVIFPLSGWAEKQLPFGEWLQGELQDRYGAPKGQAAAWVGGEQLIFLLDGLDEVTAEQRGACLRAIQAFVEDPDRRVQYVLCSRRAEYVELVEGGVKLKVPGEIVLKALQDEAIQRFLMGEEFRALRALLDENAVLREKFARIPFMLNTMAYVTRGDTPEKARLALGGRTDAASLQDYFLEEYVSRRLREQPNPRYPAAQTRRWLRWLAGQLIRERQTDFYLENMQPWWLDAAKQARRWRWGVGLAVGLAGGLAGGLAVGLAVGLAFGLAVGLAGGLMVGLGGIVGLLGNDAKERILKSQNREIEMIDRLSWSWNWWNSTVSLIGVLIACIGLAIMEVKIITPLVFSILNGQMSLLGIRLTSWLSFNIAILLPIWLILAIRSREMLRFRVLIGQGIRRSIWNGIAFGIIFGLAFGQLSGIWGDALAESQNRLAMMRQLNWSVNWVKRAFDLREGVPDGLPTNVLLIGTTNGLSNGIGGGVILGIWFGLGAFIQHYVLRFLLWRSGHLPYWRYDRFLDYAAEAVILRQVGGGYRFAHDLLRGHLAGKR